MELYAAALGRHGRAVGQVLLTRHDAADRSRYVNARNTLSTLLSHGVIPVGYRSTYPYDPSGKRMRA